MRWDDTNSKPGTMYVVHGSNIQYTVVIMNMPFYAHLSKLQLRKPFLNHFLLPPKGTFSPNEIPLQGRNLDPMTIHQALPTTPTRMWVRTSPRRQ